MNNLKQSRICSPPESTVENRINIDSQIKYIFFLLALVFSTYVNVNNPRKITNSGTYVPNPRYVVLNRTIAKKNAIIKIANLCLIK